MRRRRHGAVILAAALLLAAPALAGKDKPDKNAGDRDAIRDADRRLAQAVADHNLAQFFSLLAEDAVFVSEGKEARGKLAIARAWGPLFKEGAATLTWKPAQIDVAKSGELGYSLGSYERVGKTADGQSVTSTGMYTTVWRKGDDGRWQVVLDIGSPAPPPPAAKSE